MPPPKDETEEQKATRLAKAKKNASKAREEAMIAKYKDKVLAKEKENQKQKAPVKKEKDEDDDDDEEEQVEEVEEEEEPKPKQRLKGSAPPKKASASRPARSKIVIEQSSSDEDTFEPTKDVIFVKRIRAKPKVEAVVAPPPTPPPAPAELPAQPIAPQPRPRLEAQPIPQARPPPPNPQIRTAQQQQQQRPSLTPEQRLEMERYINMTKGVFLPQNPHRR